MSRVAHIWGEIKDRSPVLAYVGAFHLFMLVVATGLLLVDSRQVMGINAWIKPMKFMISITIYLWTVAWFVGYLKRSSWAVRIVTWGIAVCMLAETVALFIQAGRGTTSHYNFTTPFDAAVFGAMGTFIALDNVLMLGLLLLFIRPAKELASSYSWGIRLGIIVFLAGGWVGYQMIDNGAHTVGAPDGGPGLPFVNWSMEAGDLRIAHAMGLHALQIIPLLGFWLSNAIPAKDGRRKHTASLATFGGALIYATLMASLFMQAKAGIPLIAM